MTAKTSLFDVPSLSHSHCCLTRRSSSLKRRNNYKQTRTEKQQAKHVLRQDLERQPFEPLTWTHSRVLLVAQCARMPLSRGAHLHISTEELLRETRLIRKALSPYIYICTAIQERIWKRAHTHTHTHTLKRRILAAVWLFGKSLVADLIVVLLSVSGPENRTDRRNLPEGDALSVSGQPLPPSESERANLTGDHRPAKWTTGIMLVSAATQCGQVSISKRLCLACFVDASYSTHRHEWELFTFGSNRSRTMKPSSLTSTAAIFEPYCACSC